MKLLSLEIATVPFRSLHEGFKIRFHIFNDKDLDGMEDFTPFCFAGLNGSGKSNVLEALGSIFYHLECCVAKYQSDSFKKHFRKEVSNPDAYKLEYLIGQHNSNPYALRFFHKVTVTKSVGKEPVMEIQEFPFDKNSKKVKVSLTPPSDGHRAADGKYYLPDSVVAYSSGENEIISLPFIKSRLLHFDEYQKGTKEGYRDYIEPENSLIYIDEEMSQAVLLANLLFEKVKYTDKNGNEKDGALKPIVEELKIVGLRSFRMHLNLHKLHFQDPKDSSHILDHIEAKVESLKKCATTWFYDGKVILLDFFVNDATREAFEAHFGNSFNLFKFFQLLYELNANFIDPSIIDKVYESKGYYTDGKLPVGSPDQNVFYFEDYLVLKKIEGEDEPKELLLRQLSDGEHQFLHTMGICLMLKDRRSLLLLDEPETHFNPSWRAKFVKILGESIEAGSAVKPEGVNYNVHLLKDIILTSHSPFIISDCLPDHVVFFYKGDQNILHAKKASELGINTYGSSVDYIVKNFFKTNLISSKSLTELKGIIETGTLDELQSAVDQFGESSIKQFLFKKIYEKTNLNDDSED